MLLYFKVNNLQFDFRYYRAGPKMELYLNEYLSKLEEIDRNKIDSSMLYGIPKDRFTREKFSYAKIPRIVYAGVVKSSDLTDKEKEYLREPKLIESIGILNDIIISIAKKYKNEERINLKRPKNVSSMLSE